MMDLEISMINAIKESLPCELRGCPFYLGQSWIKHIGKKGLALSYTDKDSEDGKWLRGLFGLSLVPSLIAKSVFNKYCKTKRGRSSKLKVLQEYVINTYT